MALVVPVSTWMPLLLPQGVRDKKATRGEKRHTALKSTHQLMSGYYYLAERMVYQANKNPSSLGVQF